MKTILVTGGAGYIGSIAVKRLLDSGNSVIVVDNLSKGKKELVDSRAKFYELDLVKKCKLREVFEENKIDSIIHFAAYKSVEESMSNPIKYSDNISGTINLLNLAAEFEVKKFIFSSTAAVYGDSEEALTEDSPTKPVNYYGFTKLECERIIEWYGKLRGLNYICLRYFNVAGDELGYVDPDAKNVFPIVVDKINKKEAFTIFGDDYSTRDGTCIRDYIDVRDLVEAHILAVESDFKGILNLGSGEGYSVKELVESFKEVSGVDFEVITEGRRAGDPAKVIASNKKAREVLGWEPKHDLKDMVKSTLEAYR